MQMKRFLEKFWPIFCLVLLFAGMGVGGYCSYLHQELPLYIIGLFAGIALAPIVHELGHIVMAKRANMQCVYVKFFCISALLKGDKMQWSWASPFADDQTQVIPKSAENMKRRMCSYAIGGLLFGGIFLIILLILSIAIVSMQSLWIGLALQSIYLFLLNVVPLEYAAGKTDMLIYTGVQNGADAERVLLSVMAIDGYLYEGKRFAEIDEDLFFQIPQLSEEEPLFAVMLDRRYRYWLDQGNIDEAAVCLNRLASLQEYMQENQLLMVASELVYMHSITDNVDSATQNFAVCEAFLHSETATCKRILCAYYASLGEIAKSEEYRKQGFALCEREAIKGTALLEKRLLEYR